MFKGIVQQEVFCLVIYPVIDGDAYEEDLLVLLIALFWTVL